MEAVADKLRHLVIDAHLLLRICNRHDQRERLWLEGFLVLINAVPGAGIPAAIAQQQQDFRLQVVVHIPSGKDANSAALPLAPTPGPIQIKEVIAIAFLDDQNRTIIPAAVETVLSPASATPVTDPVLRVRISETGTPETVATGQLMVTCARPPNVNGGISVAVIVKARTVK